MIITKIWNELQLWQTLHGEHIFPKNMTPEMAGTFESLKVLHDVKPIEIPIRHPLFKNKRSFLVEPGLLALMSGISLGFTDEQMIKTAQHYKVTPLSVYSSLGSASQILSIEKEGEPLFGEKTIFNKCFVATANADKASCLSFFDSHYFFPNSDVRFASTQIKWTEVWPSTFIEKVEQERQKDNGYSLCFDEGAFNLNENLRQDIELDPSDYIKRSGMLTSGIIRKSVGHTSLWEDFLLSALTAKTPYATRIFDYLFNEESLKPLLHTAMRSISIQFEGNFDSGDMIYLSIKETVEGTWAQGLENSLVLKLNMSNVGMDPNINHFTENPESVFEELANDILKDPVELTGFAHFMAINQLKRYDLMPAQTISPEFDAEGFLIHLLQAHSTFVAKCPSVSDDKQEIDDIASEACKTAAEILARDRTLDGTRFSSLKLPEVIILAQAGIDPAKLPKLPHYERGLLLESSLGL